MNKTDIIQKIKQLEGITLDERSYLINLVNTKKKYGLVWEDKPEDAEEQLRTQLPVLREVVEKRIQAPPQPSPEGREKESSQTVKSVAQNLQTSLFEPENIKRSDSKASPFGGGLEGAVGLGGASAPNHILIEGDNLHALTALTFTHEGKIDVIYIDPPYNTGNKDFKYNDSFVDKEDSYRHSKWLSFMDKRLRIAKRLLSDKGVIFISIDDNEQAQLKILCDEAFGEGNFVSNVIWQHSLQAKGYTGKISLHHNYTYIYKKSDSFTLGLLDRTEEHNVNYSNPDDDSRGLWRSGDVRNALVRENLMYDIITPSGKIIKYPPKGWRFSFDTFQNELAVGKIIFSKDETRIIRKIYLADQEGRVPESIWFGKETGTTRDGTQILKDIFGESLVFDSPKPIQLINRILQIGGNKTSIVLDFFAGSGTTLHATMQMNAEDGGKRQCILVTNNENNICEEVTYERNRRIIQGYTNSKGEWVQCLTNNNLRYYKTEFVASAKTEVNRRRLTQLSTELLQIKEDCYTDITGAEGFDRNRCSIHTNERGKYMIVVYHSRTQIEVTEQLSAWIAARTDLTEKVKIYGFSSETEVLADDFYEVADRISAVPLPDAIYNAYRATFRILKLDKRASTPKIEEHETRQE